MKIEYYESTGGCVYVEEDILTYSAYEPKFAKKVLRTVDLVGEWGVSASCHAGLMKKLHGYDLYEIIIDFNKVFYRIFCVIRNGILYLLHSFCKKTSDTPAREIETAINRARKLDLLLASN